MIRPPLFGKDSSPQYTAPRLSAMCTAVFSILFFFVAVITPEPNNKQKYETVRIVLDTTPVEKVLEEPGKPASDSASETAETVQEPAPAQPEAIIEEPVTQAAESAPAPEPVKTVEPPKPAPAKSVEKPVQKPAPKAEPKKTESKPKVEEKKYTTREFNIKKSNEELMAELAESRTEKVSENADPWAQFDDALESVQTTTQQTQKRVDNKSALSGNAASSAEKTNNQQSVSNSTKTEQNVQTKADSSTTGSLKDIASTTYTKKTYTGSNSSVNMKTGTTSSGDTSVSMTDGTSRTLINPKEPKITISAEDARTINGSPTVTITFTVLADGTVPESSVQIVPRSLLTENLVSNIAWQLSNWRFQPGEAKATASFEFTIKKN